MNLSPNFWQWAAGLTSRFSFYGFILKIKRENKYLCIDIDHIDYNNDHDNFLLESFLYQAIDGINNIDYLEIEQTKKGIFTDNFKEGTRSGFLFKNYPSKTETRLAALKWIWEQEAKQDMAKKFANHANNMQSLDPDILKIVDDNFDILL